MQLSINTSLFDRANAFIAITGRVRMRHWAGVQGTVPATFVGEIRTLPLFGNRQTFACIAGWICFLASDGEMARAIRAYRLTGGATDDPETMAAALLIDGAKDVEQAVAICLPLFRLAHWSEAERADYSNCEGDEERKEIVIRRMSRWAVEIEASRKDEPSRSPSVVKACLLA